MNDYNWNLTLRSDMLIKNIQSGQIIPLFLEEINILKYVG